jgi:hypothetical protein
MKFTSVRFTHPVEVFDGDRGTGILRTYENPTVMPCDSLETDGQFLICKRGGQTKAVPLSKIESADPIAEPAAPVRKAG